MSDTKSMAYDGLLNRRRDWPSERWLPLRLAEQVLELYREKYFDLAVGMPWWIQALGTASQFLFGMNAAAHMKAGWVLTPLRGDFAFISPTKMIIVVPTWLLSQLFLSCSVNGCFGFVVCQSGQEAAVRMRAGSPRLHWYFQMNCGHSMDSFTANPQSGTRVRSRAVLRNTSDLQSGNCSDLWTVSVRAANSSGQKTRRQSQRFAIRLFEFL